MVNLIRSQQPGGGQFLGTNGALRNESVSLTTEANPMRCARARVAFFDSLTLTCQNFFVAAFLFLFTDFKLTVKPLLLLLFLCVCRRYTPSSKRLNSLYFLH